MFLLLSLDTTPVVLMRAAFIGLGKLGYPVALAWASHGHEVAGYDLRDEPRQITAGRKYPHREPAAQRLLDQGVQVKVVDTVPQAVAHGEVVFVAVETPHGPKYEGVTRLPEERADFSYAALKAAVMEVCKAAVTLHKPTVLVVISTALPGTMAREVMPLIDGGNARGLVSLVYAPMFIAQSTVVEDALSPEFVLLGVDKADARAVEVVKAFFTSMHPPEKLRFMSVASAEATKVAYNTFLGLKIVAANLWMEICHKTGADVDDVTDALGCATDRIISPKYMRGGMGDGGACHPRDLIALSWLADELNLSFDLFGAAMQAREAGTEWLAELAVEEANLYAEQHPGSPPLPIVVLGKAYKRGTNLTAGSPALLLKRILDEDEHVPGYLHQWDPHVDGFSNLLPMVDLQRSKTPAVFVIATDHDDFYAMEFPADSVVVDPWGRMKDQPDVKVIRVGRR